MLLRHIITLTCRNVRPHLIRKGQKSTNLYKKNSRDAFCGFCTVCICEICIYLFFAFIICLLMYSYYFQKSRMLCFLALSQIICLFMYLFYFQKSRNVMFSGTEPDYLFIYVFILFPEVQKCYVFQALCQNLQDRFISVVGF